MFQGIIPPMITPLRTPSQLDPDGLERQVERLLAAGVHGLFILGTTGEGPCLDETAQESTIAHTCRLVAERVPVLVGCTDASFEQTVHLAWTAANHGATALTIAPPFYFPLGQEELVTYFRRLAAKLPLPFVVYDIPSMTKTHFEPDTVGRLLDLEGRVGIKDSSGQMIYHHELLRLAREHTGACVLMGPEELLAESLLAGGSGGVPGGANIAPGLFVSLYDAAREQDLVRLAALREQLFLLREIYFQGSYASSLIKGVKTALQLLGVCSDTTVEPYQPLAPDAEQHIGAILERLDGAATGPGQSKPSFRENPSSLILHPEVTSP